MIKVFLADDEEPALKRLLKWLAIDPDVEVIGTAGSGEEALTKLAVTPADVVFLDIDMPGKNGLETAASLSEWEHPPVVVFVTAHNEYAVKAFEANAIDYVLKPFEPARLEKTLRRVKEEIQLKQPMREKLIALREQMKEPPQTIVGRCRNSKDRVLIDPAEVFFFHAHLAQVTAHLSGQEYLVTMTLGELLQVLDPRRFAQPHRAYIVNLSKVEKVVPLFNENFELILKDPKHTHVPLTRRESKEFKERLSNW